MAGWITAMLLAVAVLTVGGSVAAPQSEFDIVITGGHIYDGTGSPWYLDDIGIRNGRIAAIGDLAGAPRRQTIDAHGQAVAPGFIDMLDQSGRSILSHPRLPSKIYQGITTVVTGEGSSVAPRWPGADGRGAAGPGWTTFAEYFARLERQGIGVNFASFVGATTVRELVLGDGDVQPTPAQLEQMEALVRQAMQGGAVGLSTALQYPPAPFARTDELIVLARIAAAYGGIYATHLRSEGAAEPEAVAEAIRIGQEAHIPVEIFHIKEAGYANWGKMPQLVAQIDAARAAGVDIFASTYAYTAWSNGLSSFIPPWAHIGGSAALINNLRNPPTRARIRADLLNPASWGNNDWQEIPGPEAVEIVGVRNPELRRFEGKRLSDVAEAWHEDPMDALFDFLIKDDGGTSVAVFGMSEPDVELALRQPWVSICTDAAGTSPSPMVHPHARAYGTFPRILRKYVRQDHVLTLADAIRKMTELPAVQMRFADRGVIKQGMWADIVIFNPATIRDRATYDNPQQFAQGMDWVLVNGVPVLANGKMTNALPGKVLRGAEFNEKAAVPDRQQAVPPIRRSRIRKRCGMLGVFAAAA
ncbi:MAG TPA: D-aminoacylase [Acidobacteriaceae bacterium]|nr:D-aminoacylase [Acidobacteriaceae bacterium]